MKKSWKKSGRTYDTDRYEMIYHFVENRFYRSVWPESPFVGPGAYNRSHIDLMTEYSYNRVSNVINENNPYFMRSFIDQDRMKFKP